MSASTEAKRPRCEPLERRISPAKGLLAKACSREVPTLSTLVSLARNVAVSRLVLGVWLVLGVSRAAGASADLADSTDLKGSADDLNRLLSYTVPLYTDHELEVVVVRKASRLVIVSRAASTGLKGSAILAASTGLKGSAVLKGSADDRNRLILVYTPCYILTTSLKWSWREVGAACWVGAAC